MAAPKYGRVLIVHNRYRERGGEDAAVDMEIRLLREYGHEVILYQPDNRELADAAATIALNAIWSRRARRELADIVDSARPAIAHFHNTLPQISPAAYSAVRAGGVPVVQTLHNYRLVCANALLVRDGAPCELCVTKSIGWPGIRNACYRDSRAATAIVALTTSLHRARGTWSRDVDAYIALSRNAARLAVVGGAPEERVHVAPTFLHPDPGPGGERDRVFLYAGRLAPEKGIDVLLEAWRLLRSTREAARGWRLVVAGGGPLEDLMRAAAKSDSTIDYRGALDREAVIEAMGRAAVLVLPTHAPENLPTSVLEAYARALPVVASGTASLLEMIDESTGWTTAPGDAGALSSVFERVIGDADERIRRGAGARRRFEEFYSAARGYERLMNVFDQASAEFERHASPRRPVA